MTISILFTYIHQLTLFCLFIFSLPPSYVHVCTHVRICKGKAGPSECKLRMSRDYPPGLEEETPENTESSWCDCGATTTITHIGKPRTVSPQPIFRVPCCPTTPSGPVCVNQSLHMDAPVSWERPTTATPAQGRVSALRCSEGSQPALL